MAERRPTVAEERAAAQAAAKARRAARREAAPPDPAPDGPVAGAGLLRSDVWSTAAFVAASGAATVLEPSTGALRDAVVTTSVVLALALGAVGVVLFLVALVRGAQRSRDAEMTMAGWWFLTDDAAPPRVRRTLRGCLAVQVVTAFTTAGIRPFTELAFGTLVPICALAVCGLWSARHGSFPDRVIGAERPTERGGRR